MKIKKIERKKDDLRIYIVTFIPNWFERLFGMKEHKIEYKNSMDCSYTFGGDVYYKKDGSELGCNNWIGKAIDKYKKQW